MPVRKPLKCALVAFERDFGAAKISSMRRDAEHFEGDECLVPAQKQKSSHALVVGFGGINILRRGQNESSIDGPKRYFRGQ